MLKTILAAVTSLVINTILLVICWNIFVCHVFPSIPSLDFWQGIAGSMLLAYMREGCIISFSYHRES